MHMEDTNKLSEEDKQLKAYWHIINNENDIQNELMEISPNSLENFGSSGYIAFGLDSFSNPRFRTTEFGKEYAGEIYKAMSANLAHDDIEALFSK